jgi:hypothetical protein
MVSVSPATQAVLRVAVAKVEETETAVAPVMEVPFRCKATVQVPLTVFIDNLITV